jgi:hypothetical protein
MLPPVWTPPLFVPITWTNQPVVLYHGTSSTSAESIKNGISLTYSHRLTDFGRGFYTTTLWTQAVTWAYDRVAVSGGTPAVVGFEVSRDQLAELDTLSFVRGDFNAEDFWSLVFHCRTGKAGHRRPQKTWYDVVYGPVAAFWKQRLAIYGVDQTSFHTKKAVKILDGSKKVVIPC